MDDGTLALARIEMHEKVCADRYADIQVSVRRVESILWGTAGAVILQLLAACSYLLVHAK